MEITSAGATLFPSTGSVIINHAIRQAHRVCGCLRQVDAQICRSVVEVEEADGGGSQRFSRALSWPRLPPG